MGFGGNAEPSYIVPTAIATNDSRPDSRTRKDGVNDLDFYIGNEVGLAGKGWRPRGPRPERASAPAGAEAL